MNYLNLYNSLIEHRRTNPLKEGYFEKHHIIPKSMGGGNNKENLVKLTAREHFLAHRLLAKIYGGVLWNAYWMMCHKNTSSGKNIQVTSRQYETGRINHSIQVSNSFSGVNHPLYGSVMSEETKRKIGDANRGRVMTDETKRKISEGCKGNRSNTGRKLSPEHIEKMKSKRLTDETKRKIGDGVRGEKNGNYGRTFSEEHKRKIAESRRGKPHDEESRKRMREAAKHKPKISCPHCGKLLDIGNYKQWHGDKCKMKVG